MARPPKEGLDYFPLDVNTDQDDKFQLLEAEHGIQGFGVVVKLFMKIYSEGYYYKWSDKEQLLFSKRVNVDINDVIAIVKSCLKWNIFNEDMLNDYKILTSTGIQRRYFAAVSRRKKVHAVQEYLLIDILEFPNIVIANKNEDNVDNNTQQEELLYDRNTQSKVKKSKVKESKYTCATTETQSDTSDTSEKGLRQPFKSKQQEQFFEQFWQLYPRRKNKGQAEKAWLKISPNDALYQNILNGLSRAKRSKEWFKDGGQFIPYPATWLNAKGWEDDYDLGGEENVGYGRNHDNGFKQSGEKPNSGFKQFKL